MGVWGGGGGGGTVGGGGGNTRFAPPHPFTPLPPTLSPPSGFARSSHTSAPLASTLQDAWSYGVCDGLAGLVSVYRDWAGVSIP